MGLSAVFSIAFSPNGNELAAGGATRTMIWHLSTGRRGGQSLDVRQGAVNSVAFSPDGRFLASAGADQMITLWHNPPGRQYGIPILHNTNGQLAITPDGGLLAAGSVAGQIYLRSLRRRTCPATARPRRRWRRRAGIRPQASAARRGAITTGSSGCGATDREPRLDLR